MKSYLFPLAQTRSEVLYSDYSGRIGLYSTFSWQGMIEPGMTPLSSCKSHALKRIFWFNVFVHFIFFVVGLVLNVLDDRLGEFWLVPEKLIGVMICLYMIITLIYAFLDEWPYAKKHWFENTNVPFFMKFAWWLYDICLPASFGTLIIYFTMGKQHYEMRDGLYILNVIIMGLDMIFGRMVLVPGHLFPYFMVPVGGACWLYGLHYDTPPDEVLKGYGILIACYIVLSTVTFARARWTGTSPITYDGRDRHEEVYDTLDKNIANLSPEDHVTEEEVDEEIQPSLEPDIVPAKSKKISWDDKIEIMQR